MNRNPPAVYLAGPGVFRRDAKEYGNSLKQLCVAHALTGLWPLDNDIHYGPQAADRIRAANAIRRANEGQIIICDAIVADVSPFRGHHMDPGTAYEIGFAHALRKPLFVYSHDPRPLLTRMTSASIARWSKDGATDQNGFLIEDFGLAENLMIGTLPERVYQTATEALAACSQQLRSDRNRTAVR